MACLIDHIQEGIAYRNTPVIHFEAKINLRMIQLPV